MTERFIIENICNQVIAEGLAESEGDFCIRWLCRSEGYMRTLRFRDLQPSADALAVCANKLAFYAAALSKSDRRHSQATGRNLRELQLICEETIQQSAQRQWQGHSIH
jgi:hypothetical protein